MTAPGKDEMTPRLLTIPFSHFCEKARWAADYVGFAYREEKYLPGVHVVPTRRAGGKTVPVLVTGDETVRDSTDILAYVDARSTNGKSLYSARSQTRGANAKDGEVLALEELFDTRLGPAARMVAYHYGLRAPHLLRALVAPSMSAGQRLGFRIALPLLTPVIRRSYRIDAARVARAEATIRTIFATVSARLGEAGSTGYLVGDAFSAADLTFAALAAPVVLPPNHPAHPSPFGNEAAGHEAAQETRDFAAFVTSLRATAAGAHVTRMYREHRHARS